MLRLIYCVRGLKSGNGLRVNVKSTNARRRGSTSSNAPLMERSRARRAKHVVTSSLADEVGYKAIAMQRSREHTDLQEERGPLTAHWRYDQVYAFSPQTVRTAQSFPTYRNPVATSLILNPES